MAKEGINMSIERNIQRNKIRNKHQNETIRKAWRTFQVNKYAIQDYCDMYNKNNKNKINKLKPVDVYMV